jgi:phosphate starvation-inducible PhoH-like protein
VEILGVANAHIKELSISFPDAKIISRGTEIHIQGKPSEINRIAEIIELWLEHFHKYGEITRQNVLDYISPAVAEIQNTDKDVILFGRNGQVIKPKSANQAKMVKAMEENDLMFAIGPAGTGKTYVAVALAVKALKNKEVKKIIVTRPAVEAGESLGFLPGDMKEKIDPYIRPIYDALGDMLDREKLEQMEEKNIIEIAPLAYMRGRTLSHAFVLLDEAQNTTPMQIKMFLTRMGQGSKMIITGDKTQIDLPTKQKSGLIEALHILRNIKGIATVELTAKDVTRHPLVRDIVKAYDEASNAPMFEKGQ